MRRILLSGYYGFGNLGDEAILQAAVEALAAARDDIEIGVLSAAPRETEAAYRVRAFARAGPLSVLAAVRWADCVISGGGGLIQDATSRSSPLYYLGILRLAQALRRKTMVLAQGLGPLTRPRNIRLLKGAFRRTDAITVRDAASAEWLQQIGHTTPQPQVTGDLALLLRSGPSEAARALLRRLGEDGPIVGLVARPWRAAPEDFAERLAQVADAVIEQTGATVALLPFHAALDRGLCESVRRNARSEKVALVEASRPDEALALVGQMDALIAMRLHALIFAASAGTPFLAISYDPKVDAFVESVGETPAARAEDLDPSHLAERLARLWPRRQEAGMRLAGLAEALRRDAAKAIEAAVLVSQSRKAQ